MKAYTTLSEIRQDLEAGTITCVSLVQHYLEQIAAQEELNAFLEVFPEEALESAKAIDEKIQSGQAGRLAGLVLGIKDNLCLKGHKVGAASRILEGFESLFTSTAVQRLIDEDVIILGRLNCDEFAMGSSNENSFYGPVRNPHNPDKVPGGSSGGSAAAVAGGLVHAALGSDTGGSIRQPASFCGILGLKPTYGRISRWGLLAYASSFDQIGPFTHSAEDAALLMEVMAGEDPRDNTSSSQAVPAYHEHLNSGKTRTIGYIRECLESKGLDPEIRKGIQDMLDRLQAAGHTIKPLSFPYLDYTVPAYYILTTAEASSNLSRYDGVHYGYRSDNTTSIEDIFRLSRSEGFDAEVKRRIMLGTFVLSAGFFDAYYTKAMKVRRLIRDHTRALLEECDFLLSPTTPTTAFGIGEKTDDPIQMYLSDIFTVQANLAGNPAVSVPLGKHSDGMPYGVHLLAGDFREAELLDFAGQLMSGYQIVPA